MPRQPRPWYWKTRGAWYVQIDKKQHRLGEDKKQAEREWHRLMAAEGLLDDKAKRSMTLADACEAYMAQSQHLRQNTLILTERNLRRLAESRFGRMKLASVKPEDVVQWIRTSDFTDKGRVKTSGDTARFVQFRYTKTLFRWARNAGLIEIDPFVRVANPWKSLPRTRAMSQDEYVAIMSRPRLSDEFKEVIEFIWRTGIRPGELAALSARHLDTHLMVARFQATEHKTGTKTGLQREVYFPEDLWERLKGYAERRKAGPLLIRKNGRPWTAKWISHYFNQLKTNMGLKCVLYQARHAFATEMMARGNPPELVAKMLGHQRPDVLMSTYWHPEAEKIQDAVQQTRDAHADQKAEIEGVVARRKEEQARKQKERVRRNNARYYAEQKSKKQQSAPVVESRDDEWDW